MKNDELDCYRCHHTLGSHIAQKGGCLADQCSCNSFLEMPKDIKQPNSRLKAVPAPDDGPCQKDKDRQNIAKHMDYSAYGRGPADVFMEAVRKDQTAQRIAMKKDEDILGPHHTWQDLHDIATEARDSIYDTWNSSLHGAEQMSQVHQIVRRAMHEARRPVLEKLEGKEPHSDSALLTEAIKDFKHIIECEQAGLDLDEKLFMSALGKLGRVYASMSEKPTQCEPEKPPEPLSKSKDACPVCDCFSMNVWRASYGRTLWECENCHVVLARPLSARRDISKAPGVGAGAVGERTVPVK